MPEIHSEPTLFDNAANEGRLAIREGNQWFALSPLDESVIQCETPCVEAGEDAEEESAHHSGQEKRLPKMLKMLRSNIVMLKVQALRESAKLGRRVTESEICERALRDYCEKKNLSPEGATGLIRS